MTGFVRQHVKSEVGRPVFGTVVIDCDLIIIFKISDELLRERTAETGAKFGDVKGMQAQLEPEVASSDTPFIEYYVG